MTKPIHLDHVTAATAISDVKSTVAKMMENTQRLHGIQKGLEAVLLGCMGDAYHELMNSFNRDLDAYDTQVQKLNNAIEGATTEILHTDNRAANNLRGARS
ncbi:hypothetical protein [Nocardia sp. CA-119907]|uniref:hypothetical protein n=1 Tax=Nocardia sp. CA-119907 TaxID=3239973 RepID=UPI003D9819FD